MISSGSEPRWSHRELRLARDITAALQRFTEGAPPVLDTLLPEISHLCGFDQGYATAFVRNEAEHRWEHRFWYAHGAGPEALACHLRELARAPLRFATYDPLRPELEQRNRALRLEEVVSRKEFEQTFTYQAVWVPLGLTRCDQVRVLVCDGPMLLGWVGGMREEPFTMREKRNLSVLAPSLAGRLRWENLLATTSMTQSALTAVLEAVPAAAVIVRESGAVVHANDLARRLLAARLLTALRPDDPGVVVSFEITRLDAAGMAPHYLLVHHGHGASRYERLRRRVKEWRLTRRQSEVLDLVVRGDSNATIATKLGLRLRTVEQHVTALLGRTGCERRSELTALFWAERS